MISAEEKTITSIVDEKYSNQRLDHFLSSKFSYHSRKQWQDLIKAEMLLLNNSKTKASRKIKTGDKVTFKIDGYEEPYCNLNYSIAYEDEEILIINKPPNCIIHPVGPFFKNTLSYKLEEDLGHKVYSVNRLDRETTGLIVFTKNTQMAKTLAELFYSRDISKEYVIAVHGDFKESINAKGYLMRDFNSTIRKKRMFAFEVPKEVDEEEKIETSETLLEPFMYNNGISLVKVFLKTGRQHQIRATMCSLGYPVIGDKIYGVDDQLYIKFIESRLTPNDMDKLILENQALHSWKLKFIDPRTCKPLSIEAEIPDNISKLFN